jgi:ABC-type phosphate transport system substrate-binding protein
MPKSKSIIDGTRVGYEADLKPHGLKPNATFSALKAGASASSPGERFMKKLILSSNAGAQTIVIANAGVKASEVSKADLKDVFTGGATSLKDGSKVVPVLLKDGPSNEEFLKVYIGKADSAFRAGWRSLVFSGQATMPKSVDDDAAAVAFIAHTPGTIGYIDKASPHEGVKVLAVN